MISIVVLDPYEQFLQFLDPELCELKENDKVDGLKTLELEYKFQDAAEDKNLFRIGNKIWVQGDVNLSDCLYVINTSVKQSVFKDNSFTLEAEEVLVELNYAPLVTHTDLLTKECFVTQTTNDELTVRIDWNSLNEWFGEYFNIGVVQECLSTYVSYVPFTGTMTLMSLLRHIEEETGNVFVTRYEKDVLSNEIHRYLDFLNPINVNKNWTLNLEYNFVGEITTEHYDDNGNIVPDDKPWDVTRFLNSHVPTGQEEDVKPYDPEEDEATRVYDTEDPDYKWLPEDEDVEDETIKKEYRTYHDIVLDNIEFRILDPNLQEYTVDGTPLKWSAEDVDFDTDSGDWLISLCQTGNIIGLCVNEASFAAVPTGYTDYSDKYIEAIKDGSLQPIPISDVNVILPDNCFFEIYDSVYNQSLFRTCINNQIGTVHREVLDFGFNLEEIEHNIDETTTYTAVSPVLTLSDDTSMGKLKNYTELGNLITAYTNLKITKGQTIPMIVQKLQVKAETLELAKRKLGNYVNNSGADESTSTSNWWKRPVHPQDQKNETDATQNTWEFLRGTAYWKAPYAKHTGLLYVETDKLYSTQYASVIGRADNRDDRGAVHSPKIGTTESTDEDVYSIYNQVALYLKKHETPTIDVEVDVANLRGHEYNNYDIHDKVYIKLPDNNELITAKVVETTKEAHDVAKNTVKLSNYTAVNNIKTELQETIIHADNTSFKYPNSKKLEVTLENLDYNADPGNRTQYPANKLLAFTLYTVKDGTQTFKKTYTKVTSAYGKTSINMKYDPGDYVIEINFAGDEEYLESVTTIKVNVSGVKKVKTQKTTSSNKGKNKTTAKTAKVITKTTYYDKYGRSPDKKKILAIGLKSASKDQGSYGVFYGQEFKNKCPHCGKATLAWGIFYAGNEKSNMGKFPATGNWEGGSAEGHIFCTSCDADYSCQGHEHYSWSNYKLTTTKKRFKSSKSDAYKLRKGKYVYGTTKVTQKPKKVTNKKTNRKILGNPSSKVRKLALDIVGNKTGYNAMRAICSWMDKNIHYSKYYGFLRSPNYVLQCKHGNCCDQTRLLLQLLDAAGVGEYYDMYYVNLSCPSYGHVYGRVRSKKTGKWTNVDPASDAYGCYGYVCDSCSRTSPVDSKYPHMPF